MFARKQTSRHAVCCLLKQSERERGTGGRQCRSAGLKPPKNGLWTDIIARSAFGLPEKGRGLIDLGV